MTDPTAQSDTLPEPKFDILPETEAAPERPAFSFAPPALITGEDPADWDRLEREITATIQPVDFIEQMFVRDLVQLAFDEARYTRAKARILDSYREPELARMLRPGIEIEGCGAGEDASADAQSLASIWVSGDGAVDEEVDHFLKVQGYDVDTLMARITLAHFEKIERFDALIANVQGRRIAIVREIELRRETVDRRRRRSLDLLQLSSTGTLPRANRRSAEAYEPDPPLKGMGLGLDWSEP